MMDRHMASSGRSGTLQIAWNRECYHAIDTLNDALCNAPVLALQNTEGNYCVHMDDHKYALGAELSQVEDTVENLSKMYFCHWKPLGVVGPESQGD